jgi:glc operon protein GlcG
MRTRPCLTSTDLDVIMAGCRAEATKNSWNVTIAIVDEGGHLLRFERMDGAGPGTAEIAIGKARTSAVMRRPTKVVEDRVKDRPALLSFPNLVLVQGAVPILHSGECVGAVGVSGAQSHEDEQVATAGIGALG